MEDDFALRYVRNYPGVNSRAELVTLAPGLRPERRFAPLARGQLKSIQLQAIFIVFYRKQISFLTIYSVIPQASLI